MRSARTRLLPHICIALVLSLLTATALADVGDIAIYREATAGDTITTNDFGHGWDTVVREAGSYSLAADTTNILCKAGHHLVMYSARFDDPGNNGGDRSEIQSQLRLAGADLPTGWSQCFIRRQNGDYEGICAGGGIIDVAADGDPLMLRSFRTDAEADGIIREPDASSIQLLTLDDSWDYCRLSITNDQVGPNTAGGWTPVLYDQQDEMAAGAFVHTSGGADVIIMNAGHYLVFANTYCSRPDNGTRSSIRQRLTLNGIELDGSRTTVYLRGNANDDVCLEGAASIGMIFETTGVQVLRVECANGANGLQHTYKADRTAITIVRLPDSVEYIRLGDSAADNFNPDATTALGWDTASEVDIGFTHNDSRIGAAFGSDFLLLSALYDDDDGGQRIKYWQRWRVNGGTPEPFGHSGRYARNNEVQDCGNWSGILLKMKQGDYVETVSERLGNAGVLSATRKGVQGIRIPTLTDRLHIAADAASDITPTSAMLNATLTWTGSVPVEVWVYWGETDQGTNLIWDASHYFDTNMAAVPAAYSNMAMSLAPDTTYVYRYRAMSSRRDLWTDAVTFRTTIAPEVDNTGATPGQGYALLDGNMLAGNEADVAVYWGTSDGGMDPAAWENTNAIGTLTNGPFHGDTRGAVDEPWTNVTFKGTDIMPPDGIDGSTVESSGDYTLTAGGADIWGTADQCHYAYRKVGGDFDVWCRVSTFTGGANAWRKAGIMARESIDTGSRNVALMRAPTNGNARVAAQYRAATDGDSVSEHFAAPVLTHAFYWIRLARSGDTFSFYWAEDNSGTPGSWTNQHSDVTLDLNDTLLLGVGVTSHAVAETTTVTFSDLAGTVHSATGDLIHGLPYYYRSYATNTWGDDWSDVTVFTPAAPTETAVEYQAGLGEANVPGGLLATWVNPATNSVMGPEAAKTQNWPGTATWIYSGEIYFDGNPYVFVESIDDDVWLKIDGTVVMNNGNAWDRSSSGIIDKPTGWYDFELRMYQGTGAAGYIFLNPGFQYNHNGLDSLADKDNGYPEDDGNMSLFRHLAKTTAPANSIANLPSTDVLATAATLNGRLDADGATYDVTVYWGSANGGTNAAVWANTNHVASYTNQSAVALSHDISGLSSGQQLYYTFAASNMVTTLWGQPSEVFSTASQPTVSNAPATDVTGDSATLNGVLAAGGSADMTVFWGTTDGGASPAWENTTPLGSLLAGPASLGVSNLLAGQTYYYRFNAGNSMGSDWADSSEAFTTPLPSLSVADVSVAEPLAGTAPVVFAVTLSPPPAGTVSFDYATAQGTANQGADYIGNTGIITLPAGVMRTNITVLVRSDDIDEGTSEVFSLVLSNPANAAIGDGTATCTITDDDTDMSAWKYKMKITFGGYEGGQTLTNFPALAVFNESLPGFSYNSVASPAGSDLLFMDAGETNLLNHEIEEWNIDGDSFVWVQVPELVDTNTFVWAYWGNPYRAEPPPSQTDGSVWTEGFEGVWHLNTPNPLDSTAHDRHGVANDAPAVTNGVVGTALSYDGVDDWATIDYVGILEQANRTCSAWIKKDVASTPNVAMMSWGRNTASQKWVFRTEDGNGGIGSARVEVNGGYSVGATPLLDGQWHHVAAVLAYDGNANVTDIVFYVDGALDPIAVELDQTVRTKAHASMVLGGDGFAARTFDAPMDEARVASVARSGDWLRASYLTVASNSTFLSYGQAVPARGDVPLIDGATASGLDDASATLSAELTSTGTAAAAAWVYWGEDAGGEDPGYWANSAYMGAVTQAPPLTLTMAVNGLFENTSYHFAFRATNSAGECWTPASFETPGEPSVTTDPATDVSINTATLRGTLAAGGGGAVSIFWGLTDSGTDAAAWEQTNTQVVADNGAFSTTIAPFANGSYFYRCYATNDYGQAWAAASETFATPMSTVSILDTSVNEGSSSANVTISLSWPSAANVTVDYATADGTAVAGSDYTSQAGQLLIPAGQSSANVSVPIAGDSEHEWPYETFAVAISNVTGAILTDSNAVVRILDDDLGMSSWKADMTITFSGYTGTQVLTNFPALVVLGPSRLGFDYKHVASPQGYDLRFTGAGGQLLDFEIEDWNTNGESYVWVRIPELTSSTTITAYWGNPAATYEPFNQTDGSVWGSDHLAVYHMHTTNTVDFTPADTNAAGFMADVTTNALHANRYANQVNPALPFDDTGLIAGGQHFQGNPVGQDGVTARHSYQYPMSPAPQALPAYSVMAWCKPDHVPDQYTSVFNNSGGDDFQLAANTAGQWTYVGDNNGGTPVFGTITTDWTHLAIACDPNSPMTWVYFNGALVATIAATDNDWGRIEIGTNRNRDNSFIGVIDEVRVMRAVSSADWIKAVWMNSGQNATFNAYGAIDTKAGMVLIVR